jgi:hypothetical protein
MIFKQTPLPGVVLIEPRVHCDERGFFLETYHRDRYVAGGVGLTFVQDNHSRSVRGTLRGLHAQLERPQGKLIRVIEGEIFDLALDIRRGSATFAQWFGTRSRLPTFISSIFLRALPTASMFLKGRPRLSTSVPISMTPRVRSPFSGTIPPSASSGR